jgi:chromosomal replication initiation ATPase DnaA
VAKIIADETGYSPFERVKYRKREYVEARQILLTLLCNRNGKTLNEIGLIVQKDHATVIHAQKAISDRLYTEKEFRELYDKIEKRVKAL